MSNKKVNNVQFRDVIKALRSENSARGSPTVKGSFNQFMNDDELIKVVEDNMSKGADPLDWRESEARQRRKFDQ